MRQLHTEAACGLYAGIHQPDGALGLIVEAEVAAFRTNQRVPKSAGFLVETMLLGHSHSGRVRIILSLAHASYAQVFAILCRDAVEVVLAESSDRSAVAAFIGRLHVWQAFMMRYGPDGLSQAAAIGLMGELYVLRDHLAPLIGFASSLAAWAGPRGEPNDFALSGGYLEIKATTRQAPDRISISNAEQLDISRGRILLGHVRFRETPEGDTLPEMVEAIRTELAVEAPAALAGFATALLAAGYVDAHRDIYDLRLASSGLELFEVGPDFPHLAPGELRSGIVDCSYTIDIATCRSWTSPQSALPALMEVACV